MNTRLFDHRALLVAMALAAATGAGAQTTDGAAANITAESAPLSAPDSSTSYAPCSTMEGAALTECLKKTTTWTTAARESSIATITSRTTLDSSTSATASKAKRVDNSFRAELRRCVQLPSDLRDNCLDGVIENRAQS